MSEIDDSVDLFSPVVPERMSAQILQQIQSGIDSGALKSGDRLPAERDLAERFQVSRVTVRDALRALEALGLVEIRLGQSGGAFITVPSTEVIGQALRNLLTMSSVSPRDVAETRLSVEISVVALAIARCDPSDLDDLEAIYESQARDLEAAEPRLSPGSPFHVRLAAATKNEGLRLLVKSFRGPMAMLAVRSSPPTVEGVRQTIAEHRAITGAMRAGDTVEAQRQMAMHLLRDIAEPNEARLIADELRGIAPHR